MLFLTFFRKLLNSIEEEEEEEEEDEEDGEEEDEEDEIEEVVKPGPHPVMDSFSLDVLERVVHTMFDTGEVVSQPDV